ncbi:TetR family transcriptional regulator [Frigoribacterium sp. VKM Ac-2836]|uniref:TetR family transcriptional regulator n=1 Tax=Frigoribacterium sp. VKM Ac-2836 TaxID=2739014 RepID=UPI0015673153|nr:TetR family transcriptional regulator [Frigoribacterium sp. VKM Ac-2836]NRD26913.1 TetR family transcriptional regulator [Frigoribacterium sp. VKM Ac-2836]
MTGRPRSIDPEAVALVALRLFDTQGFDAVSMDDIATAAGISRRSLFRLFPTKASLVWGGLDEFTDRLRASLSSSDADLTVDETLEAGYRAAVSFIEESLEVTRRRLHVITANPALAGEGATRIAAVTAFVARFIAEKEGLDADALGVTIRAHTYTAAVTATLAWWSARSDSSPNEALESGLRLFRSQTAHRAPTSSQLAPPVRANPLGH